MMNKNDNEKEVNNRIGRDICRFHEGRYYNRKKWLMKIGEWKYD